MLRLTSCVLALAALATGAAPAAAQAPETQQVIAAAQRLFDGMRTRDTALLRRIVAPQLVLVSVRDSAGHDIVRHQTVDQFIRSVATAPGELRERMWNPEVRIDGGIATLWAPYEFHIGERFSHCGYDSFQFARYGDEWVITGLLYTVRQGPCPAGGDG